MDPLVDATLRFALALSHGHLDLNATLWLVELERLLAREGESLEGRWCRTPLGYVHVAPGAASGRFSRELPAGIDPAEVLEPPPLQVVPGRDRLGALLAELERREDPGDDVREVHRLAFNAWQGAAPGAGEMVFESLRDAIAAAAGADALPEAAGEVADDLLRAYAELHLDSSLVSLAVTTHAVVQAVDEAWGRPAARELVGATFAAGPGGPVDRLVREVCRRDGPGLVEQAAAALAQRSDVELERALDAQDRHGHLRGLHATLPWSLGAFRLSHFVAGLDRTGPDAERRRRAKAGADEHQTKIAHALQNAVRALEAPVWEAHRAAVARALREEGEAAAARRVAELVEVHFLYPRCMAPQLRGAPDA